MADQTISQSQFEDEDLPDWTWSNDQITATFQPDGFSAGARFALQIAAAADAMNHHPEIDLRYGQVEVRLTSHDVEGITERDLSLAKRTSEIAHEQEIGSRGED